MKHQADCAVCGGGLVSMVAGGSLIQTLSGTPELSHGDTAA
jgi:hypothetical protein